MKRIPQIDGFRALAILLVISFHYINNQLVNSQSYLGKMLCLLTSFGWIGVDLFFVISGFLIGSILLINKNSGNIFRTFYIRRFVRIVPNYYLLIIVFLLIKTIPFFSNNYFVSGNNVIPAWSYFLMVHNFYMAALHNLGNNAMSVTWSIGIEEQFYIIFPFFILFIKEKWLPYFLMSLIIAAIFFRSLYPHWIPAYVLLPCRMDAISFGILIALFNNNYNLEHAVKNHFIKIAGLMVFSVAVCGFLFYKYQDIGIARNTIFALFFSCLIVVALGRPKSFFSKILSNKLLSFIGKISYSLYLFHYLILGLFNGFGEIFFNMQSTFVRIILSITALLVSIIFSWIVYKFLEKPAVSFGKKFNYQSA